MAIRQLSVLKQHGFEGSRAEFRHALTGVKDARYPGLSDEDLTYTRDEADAYCTLVRGRVGVPTLPRAFILRSLAGVRKHPLKV